MCSIMDMFNPHYLMDMFSLASHTTSWTCSVSPATLPHGHVRSRQPHNLMDMFCLASHTTSITSWTCSVLLAILSPSISIHFHLLFCHCISLQWRSTSFTLWRRGIVQYSPSCSIVSRWVPVLDWSWGQTIPIPWEPGRNQGDLYYYATTKVNIRPRPVIRKSSF